MIETNGEDIPIFTPENLPFNCQILHGSILLNNEGDDRHFHYLEEEENFSIVA